MLNPKPTLIIIAGPNGSGKTTITSKVLKHEWVEGCVYINPDEIAKEIFGNWNSPEAVLKAAIYALEMREKCLLEKKSLIFETVFSSGEKLEFILKAQKAGYFIQLFFVATNHPSINASRIARRILEGGHDVPISKIISRYSKSINNCRIASKIIDGLYIYDNSIDFEEATLLFRASNGKVTKKYGKINDWAMPIFDALIG